ncbi:hypothetical protein RCC89_01650 [Cytophagaceae bacterium ABcell3]|nr:hypothetical protein RCC89_01650 [Cytophagaceae bacterium ABcell3]
MNNEHNPIALKINKIQNKWIAEASPLKECKLVRWLLKDDQPRLFEGFLRLEASASGALPEVVVTMLMPFEGACGHSKKVMKDWLKELGKDENLVQSLENSGYSYFGSLSKFEVLLEDKDVDGDRLFVDFLSDFQGAACNGLKLALALYPQLVSDVKDYTQWLDNLLKVGLPEDVLFMVFDFADERYFDKLVHKYPEQTKTLYVSTGGDEDNGGAGMDTPSGPADPEVRFRECVLKMSDAVNDNNLSVVKQWGQKGLEVAQSTGSAYFLSVASLTYGAMLFNFKETGEIKTLIERGLVLARKGLDAGDNACQQLLVTGQGYMAACCQIEGKKSMAAAIFEEQGDLAVQYGMPVQALTAWWQAADLYKEKDKEKHALLLEKAYRTGAALKPEELEASCMAYIAFDYHEVCRKKKDRATCAEIDTFMAGLNGPEWMGSAERHKKESKRKKRFIVI